MKTIVCLHTIECVNRVICLLEIKIIETEKSINGSIADGI